MAEFRNLPEKARVDAPLWGKLVGVPNGAVVELSAEVQDDFGQSWRSRASYPVRAGEIDLAGGVPSDAPWSGSDAYGLYWSMRRQATEPSPFLTDPGTVFQNALRPVVTARLDGEVVAQGEVERRYLFRCAREEWRGEVVANLFVPTFRDSYPAALVIGGSGGGFAWSNQAAALIAASGRAALAVAYFDWEGVHGLPHSLTEISLELFTTALDRLLADPRILPDDLAVVGFSKGSEAALLTACRRPDVTKVVAYAPSAYVWAAARVDPSESPRSSWTWQGNPLPFLAFEAGEDFYRTFDKTTLRKAHDAALAQPDLDPAACIPVEQTDADLLLISGTKDSVWSSGEMAETLLERLKNVGKGASSKHLSFGNAGHTLLVPGLPAERNDGDPAANAYADRKSWGALRAHLGF